MNQFVFKWREQCLILASLSLLLLGAAKVNAHALEQGYLYLDFNQPSLEGRFELTVTDLNKALSISLPIDGSLKSADLVHLQDDIARYLGSRLTVAPNGVPTMLEFASLNLMTTKKAQYLLLPFTTTVVARDITHIDVEYRVLFDVDPAHRGFVLVENDWESSTFDNEGGISLVFNPDSGPQQLDLSSSTATQGFLGMVELGVHHIWDGIDHLLFLFALLIPAVVTRVNGIWKPVEKFGSALCTL